MAVVSTWYKIRHEFYRQIHEQVLRRLGKEPIEIKKYRKTYEKEFEDRWRVSDRETLFKQINESQLIYFGDFHPMAQSQKSHLRILKNIKSNKNTVLALECFWSDDQSYIDKYIKGTLSEREFLKKIEWVKNWGFPWENYRPLLDWAKTNKVRVIGLNGPERKLKKDLTNLHRTELETRDKFAAHIISDQFRNNKNCKMFVIYGDLHLAESRLPARVKNELSQDNKIKVMRVMQNSEKIYFQLLKKGIEDQVDIVRMPRNTFCVMSVAPWVKWQNFLLELEKTDDKEIDEENDSDLTDHVSQYIKVIAEDLKLKIDLSHLSVFTARDPSLWRQIQSRLSGKQMELIELMIEDERPFYIPQVGVAYLSRMSVNHAAALAMLYIHAHICSLKKWSLNIPEDFYRLIWLEALSYFGSKLINPKRKTETMSDVKMMLASKSPRDSGKEALRLALAQKMMELSILAQRSERKFSYEPKTKKSYLTAANLLGGMMGEKMYTGYRQKMLKIETINSFLMKDWTSASFKQSYYEILATVEELPVSFKSKTEKL